MPPQLGRTDWRHESVDGWWYLCTLRQELSFFLIDNDVAVAVAVADCGSVVAIHNNRVRENNALVHLQQLVCSEGLSAHRTQAT